MKEISKKIKYTLPIALGGILTFVGILFKIQHWGFAIPITAFGSLIVITLISIRFAQIQKKTYRDHLKLILTVSLCTYAVVFVFGLSYAGMLGPFIIITLITWGFMEGYNFFRGNKNIPEEAEEDAKELDMETEKRKSWIGTIFTTAAILILTGAFLKISNIDGSNILLVAGILLGTLWMIMQLFKKSE